MLINGDEEKIMDNNKIVLFFDIITAVYLYTHDTKNGWLLSDSMLSLSFVEIWCGLNLLELAFGDLHCYEN